jgi:chromate transporter
VSISARPPSYGRLSAVFLRLSLLGFGGPNVHLALMLDEVVERRRWLDREHFLQLISLTSILPGPNSSEVAIHVGYTRRGWRGALVTGLSFLAPTFVLVVLLSFVYFKYGTVPAVGDVFWALKPVVVALILTAGWKLGKAAITDRVLLALAGGGLAVALLLDAWEVAAMAVGGAVTWLIYRRGASGEQSAPAHAEPSGQDGKARGTERKAPALMLAPLGTLFAGGEIGRLFVLMLWTGSVLFGGGYMLVALLEPVVVGQYGWLTTEQFLDGIPLTQAVPGPIVTLVAFVGYGVAGVPGAFVATFGIYLPSFAAVLAVAPLLERWRHVEGLRAVLRGVNAIVVGAILGVALSLLPAAVPDPVAAFLFVAALVAGSRFGVGAVWLVGAGLLVGALRALAF